MRPWWEDCGHCRKGERKVDVESEVEIVEVVEVVGVGEDECEGEMRMVNSAAHLSADVYVGLRQQSLSLVSYRYLWPEAQTGADLSADVIIAWPARHQSLSLSLSLSFRIRGGPEF